MDEIKKKRLELGLTMKQFSEFLGVPNRTYEKWERKERPAPDYIVKFIKFYIEHQPTKKESP